ncbi:MAG: hypothetical protein ACRYF5_18195 [Janthinobacterium lividum]
MIVPGFQDGLHVATLVARDAEPGKTGIHPVETGEDIAEPAGFQMVELLVQCCQFVVDDCQSFAKRRRSVQVGFMGLPVKCFRFAVCRYLMVVALGGLAAMRKGGVEFGLLTFEFPQRCFFLIEVTFRRRNLAVQR